MEDTTKAPSTMDLCDSSDRSSLAPECDTTLKKEECLSILRMRIEFSERFYKNATEIYIKSKDQELVSLDADPYRNVLTFQTLNDEKLGKLDHNTIFNKLMKKRMLTCGFAKSFHRFYANLGIS